MKAKYLHIYLVGVVMCIGCLTFSDLNAQKTATKALGIPEKINPPKDYFQTEASYQNYIGAVLRDSKLDGKNPWIVFSDRADNPTFSSPDVTSSEKTRLGFGDACIVIDQNQDWIELIKGRTSGLQIVEQNEYLGWIKKDKMLLWQGGLVNVNTGIHQKAFLLNKAKEYQAVFDQNDKNRVPIYNSPTSGDEVQPSSIYRYFFVFKKDNNRYLLAQESRIYPENVQIRLVGWVPQSRCADWNTRLAYEPNNSKLAYEERKANPDFQVKAYDDRPSAVLHSSGIPSKSRVLWEKDPVIANSLLISEQNPYRFKGSVVRFPLLSEQTQMIDNVIATGIVGDITVKAEDGRLIAISEESNTVFKEYTQADRSNSENVNVLYLIEGSAEMGRYKDVIRNLFSTTKAALSDYPNSNIGMVVYRGIEERPLKKDIEILSLNKNEAAFKRFVDSIQFTRFYNASEYSNLRYAIKEGISSAGFDPSHTNIIVVLGSSPDFASNKALREKAMLDNDPAVISAPDMVDILSKVNASIYFIQCSNDELGPGAMFKRTADNILVELGKDQYSKALEITKKTGITLKIPVLLDNAGSGVTELVHGALPGFTYLPKPNAVISGSDLTANCTKALSNTAEFVSKFNQAKDRLVEEGKSLEEISHSAGEFSMPMAMWLTKFMQETSQGSDQIDIGNITKTKYQLFKEMFIPFYIKGAQYPALSYVLFMPASELSTYMDKLKLVENAARESTDEKRRLKLFDVFKQLILQFSGNSGVTETDIQNMDYREFTALMNGVKAEGLRLPEDQIFEVGEILDSRAMPMSEINKWITRLMTKLENLKKIYREGKNYPFAFSVGDEVYFWITLEESF